ncbi:MAG: hypothetical protein V1484_00640 [bacterium]
MNKKLLSKAVVGIVVGIIVLSLLGCGAMMKNSLGNSKMFSDDGSVTVIIVTGVGERNEPAIKKWANAFPGAVVVDPDEHWPLASGAEDIARQIGGKITGRVVPIGLSYGGNLGREFVARFPHLAVAVLTVGSPNTVKFMPEFPAAWLIRPSDGGSNVPLFAAVGVKPGVAKPAWMDDPSDGTIGLAQAIDFRDRKVEEIAVFKCSHTELFEDDSVIEWAKERLSPFLKPKSTTVASATEK